MCSILVRIYHLNRDVNFTLNLENVNSTMRFLSRYEFLWQVCSWDAYGINSLKKITMIVNNSKKVFKLSAPVWPKITTGQQWCITGIQQAFMYLMCTLGGSWKRALSSRDHLAVLGCIDGWSFMVNFPTVYWSYIAGLFFWLNGSQKCLWIFCGHLAVASPVSWIQSSFVCCEGTLYHSCLLCNSHGFALAGAADE